MATRRMDLSALVRHMLFVSELSTRHAATELGISVVSFREKLKRNSFSFEDIVKTAKVTGCELTVYDGYVTVRVPRKTFECEVL